MRTVKILSAFSGYPSGSRVDYAEGQVVSVPNGFADNIIEKGLAEESTDTDEESRATKSRAAAKSAEP